jgi:hypothetical protein
MKTVTSSLILFLAAFNRIIPSAFAFVGLPLTPVLGDGFHSRRLAASDLSPFKMSATTEGSGGGQHLIRAGQELHAAAESVGPQDNACPRLLKDAGDSLSEIGEYWTESWEAVTYAAEDASSVFLALAKLQGQTQPGLARLYSGSANELREISSIVGCTSVGPPTAAPNLEGLSRNLQEAAKYVEQCGDDCSEDGPAFGKSLLRASKSIQALAREYQ